MEKTVRKVIVGAVILLCVIGYFVQKYNNYGLVYGETITRESELMLVNNKNKVPREYIPKGLVIPCIEFIGGVSSEEKYVSSRIKEPLEKMIAKAAEDGVTIMGCSGYRSYNSQKDIYDSSVEAQGKSYAESYVAVPGSSEHQTGLCIDLTNVDNNLVEGTEEASWLKENSYRFGFIIRYPKGKGDITGIDYEPWHVRYVGDKAAKYIYDNNLTLEEYLGEK